MTEVKVKTVKDVESALDDMFMLLVTEQDKTTLMAVIKEYGGLCRQEVIDDPEEFGIVIPNCDDCEERRSDGDDGRYDAYQ